MVFEEAIKDEKYLKGYTNGLKMAIDVLQIISEKFDPRELELAEGPLKAAYILIESELVKHTGSNISAVGK